MRWRSAPEGRCRVAVRRLATRGQATSPSGRVWIFALLLACCRALGAEEGSGTISGFVYSRADGEALIRASVSVRGLGLGSISNESGYFVIPDLPAGRWPLVASFIGFEDVVQSVIVGAGGHVRIDLFLDAKALQAEEVLVRGDSLRMADRLFARTVSTVHLAPRDIEQVPPFAEADLLRSLATLPGIVPLSDFSSALYVRGGTPDQNLYLIDGAEVYSPEHAFGLFSTFNTDAIKQVELSKGGFGPERGGRLSSVLDVANVDGSRERFQGVVAISLLSVKSTLQTPLGTRGSLSGSLRRTYFDQTIGRRSDDIPDYYFYDGHIKATVDLSDVDRLTLGFFGGRDVLDITYGGASKNKSGFGVAWQNQTASARYVRVFTPRFFGQFGLTTSRFASDFAFSEGSIEERNGVNDVTLKGHVQYDRSSSMRAEAGYEWKRLQSRYAQDFLSGKIDVRDHPEQAALYGAIRWNPRGGLGDVLGGVRYSRYRGAVELHHIEPRIALKYRLTESSMVKVATGVYHQYVHRVPRFIAADIWTAANAHQGASRAVHYIVGYQREWHRVGQLEVEAFHKRYSDIYQFNRAYLGAVEASEFDERDRPTISSTRGLFNVGDGYSSGFEILLRKDAGPLSGWVGYSLARTRHVFAEVNGGRSFSPRHDRTSTLNAVARIDLSKALRSGQRRWFFGANMVYSTGQPITEPGSAYVASMAPSDPQVSVFYAPTRINGVRLPAYVRLDVSLEWQRNYGSWQMMPYLQIFNVGNRRNTWFIDYDFANSQPEVDEVSMFPILPTCGLRIEF